MEEMKYRKRFLLLKKFVPHCKGRERLYIVLTYKSNFFLVLKEFEKKASLMSLGFEFGFGQIILLINIFFGPKSFILFYFFFPLLFVR